MWTKTRCEETDHRRGFRRGVTLIELLIAITLTSMIASCVSMIFNAAMEAWRFGEETAAIETVAPELINRITEGDYASAGLVDALTVVHADQAEVAMVPLVVAYVEPDLLKNDEQIFELPHPFLAGSPLPKGQVRIPGQRNFQNVRTALYGAAESGGEEGDRVQFMDELPEDAEVRVVYRPDHTKDQSTVMTFRWDGAAKTLTREYQEAKTVLSENSFGVDMTDVRFMYYSNVNQEIPLADGPLGESELRLVTAAKIIASARRGDTERTITQFVNMRNLGWSSAGIVVAEGMELEIPNSLLIRALSVTNVFGVEEESRIELSIESAFGKTWYLVLTYDMVDEEPTLLGYKVEYPSGKTAVDRPLLQPAAQEFSLLTLDDEGRFDYDDDQGVEDVVLFDDEAVTLRVEKMEAAGAAIYVRP